MRNGFTFNGRHSSEFEVTVKTKSRPLRPSVKEINIDMPCRDGVYDFSEANPYGREFFNERIFIMVISVYADNLNKMQNKLSAISLWLTGKGELIFDDIPLVKWYGRIFDEIMYMPEHNGRKTVIEVSFRAEPFGFGVFDTDGPTLGTEIELDTNIPMQISDFMSFTVKGKGDLNVINFGDRPIRPVIEITGQARGIVLGMGDKSLSFNADGDVSVDFEKQNVTGENGSIKVLGDFFEFPAGNSVLHIENSNTSNLTVQLSYVPQFMYSVHFDDVEWSVNNA